ncbi:uncharacterized protein LOC106174061 [Lingula anatina]|uniref:Uncharacterized protein LOC106174061 n=1 Tax=Lingula anatina TaxID=7574 RepID=A0A1S3JL84_LINAN|nr:uncharacterized protein LOC106174061 [Lingula anatina]XP_013410901.1 uncharacterized protein LOC106174061 [Lingula anatina]|eukprot:XP_013410900.1 uncharacterized protein LOC106174061 [Lingula anatina]
MKSVPSQGSPCSSSSGLDYTSVCDGNLLKMIDSYASALGTNREYVLFPLLASVSGLLTRSRVQLSDMWEETCTMWCVTAARRCSKKTTVLNQFLQALHEAGTEAYTHIANLVCREQCDPNQGKNNILLEEDLSLLAESDYTSKGGSLKSHFDNTWQPGEGISIGGFMSKEKVAKFIYEDPLQVADRFLIALPGDVTYKPSECKVPMPSNTPLLSEVFKVLCVKHTEKRQYTLSPEAHALFTAMGDHFKDCSDKHTNNDDRYAMYRRAPSLLARLAATITSLRQALKYVVYHEDLRTGSWCDIISKEDLESSQSILQWVIDLKCNILDQKEQQENTASQAAKMNGTSLNLPSASKDHNNLAMLKRSHNQEQGQEFAPPPSKQLRGTSIAGSQGTHPSLKPHQQQPPLAPPPLIIPTPGPQVSQGEPQGDQRPVPPPPQHRYYQTPGSVSLTPGHPNPPAKSSSPSSPPEGAPVERGNPFMNNIGPFITNGAVFSSETAAMQDNMGSHSLHHIQQQQLQSQSPQITMSNITTGDLRTFLSNYSHKIKKFLEFKLDYRISPSMAAQRHIIPPLTREEMQHLNTMNRYPVTAAREFLHKTALLGFGRMEYGTISHNRASMFFVKFPYQELGDRARQLLSSLGVHPVDYNAAFTYGNGNTGDSDCKYLESFGTSPENLHEDGSAIVKTESE